MEPGLGLTSATGDRSVETSPPLGVRLAGSAAEPILQKLVIMID